MVKREGDSAAIFPFKMLQHSYTLGSGSPPFDAEKEKVENNELRENIQQMIRNVNLLVDRSNARAVLKAEHYIAALTAQLAACDKMDDDLDLMNTPIYLLRERQQKTT